MSKEGQGKNGLGDTPQRLAEAAMSTLVRCHWLGTGRQRTSSPVPCGAGRPPFKQEAGWLDVGFRFSSLVSARLSLL